MGHGIEVSGNMTSCAVPGGRPGNGRSGLDALSVQLILNGINLIMPTVKIPKNAGGEMFRGLSLN